MVDSACNRKRDEAKDATKTKPFNIDKKLVYDGYEAVKLCRTQNTGWPNDWFHCQQAAQTVRTLESKQYRRICLMGAV